MCFFLILKIFNKDNYNFKVEKVLSFIGEIELQINNNINQLLKPILIARDLQQEYLKFQKGKESSEFNSNNIEEFQSKKENIEKIKLLFEEQEKVKENPFIIEINKKIPIDILQLLSLEFGDNKEFLEFKKTPAWPTNNSLIYKRPLIKDKDNYYCFIPTVLFRNIGYILEAWIKEKDLNYFHNIYQKRRSKYLEKKSLEYFKKLLPKSKIYGELYYDFIEDGQKKRVSTDGLVLFDENLFIIEAKAGSLSIPSKRGGLKELKSEIGELIDKAYIQALRTKKYINENPNPRFEDAKGETQLIIRDKNKYKNIFLINTTLYSIDQISLSLNSLRRWNLLKGSEWLWSIYINDLRIISELIEIPSIFIYYLKQRIIANDHPKFRTADELDYLMFYYKKGLYFKDGILDNLTAFMPTGFTEDLDRYYDYKAGRVSDGKKPILEINKDYKKLILDIEETNKLGFTRINTILLGFDKVT